MDRQDLNALRSVEELRAYQRECRSRRAELNSEYAGLPFPDEAREEYAWCLEDDEEVEARAKELEARDRDLQGLARDDNHVEREPTEFLSARGGIRGGADSDDIYDLSTVPRSFGSPEVEGRVLKDRAQRALEIIDFRHPEADQDATKAWVEKLLKRTDTDDGQFARYVLATASPTYKRAWAKAMSGRLSTLSREEQSALSLAETLSRGQTLTGNAGGFAVPFELDPTVLFTSSGVVNPIRQIANVETISVDEWRGVTSAGVTAAYEAELTQVADSTATLVQPTISTEKAHVFVPFSIEVGQDWSGIETALATAFADAKDALEASKFIIGTGTNEPFGVLTGTTNTVNAATGQTFTLANLYALRAALPPRYRARAAFVGDLLIGDRLRQFDTVGSPAAIWVDSLQDDNAARLLGKPFYEASEMPDTPATGAKFLLYGDFSRYKIVDRVGMTTEYIPHLFGANGRPTGQRGLYCYWRNGAKVIDANAFRALLGVA